MAWGQNTHGQCGTSNLTKNTVIQPHSVYIPTHSSNDPIQQVVCGKSHTVYYTQNNHVFLFGAN